MQRWDHGIICPRPVQSSRCRVRKNRRTYRNVKKTNESRFGKRNKKPPLRQAKHVRNLITNAYKKAHSTNDLD